jgi:hypothetical protein
MHRVTTTAAAIRVLMAGIYKVSRMRVALILSCSFVVATDAAAGRDA